MHDIEPTKIAAQAQLLRRQQYGALEQAMPSFLLHRTLESLCKTQGFEIRPELAQNLSVAMVVPLKKLDNLAVSWLAKKLLEDGQSILEASNCTEGDVRPLALAVCLLIMKLVEEGMLRDKTNVGVMHAMEILLEAEEAPELWTDTAGATVYVNAMFNRLVFLGYYAG